jgi:predicted dehydrogenase
MLTLYGRDGTLAYNFTRDEVLGARRGEKELSVLAIPPELQSSWTVEKDFVEAVLAGARPEPSFETGVRYMQFTEAVYRSARGGHAVELPLP